MSKKLIEVEQGLRKGFEEELGDSTGVVFQIDHSIPNFRAGLKWWRAYEHIRPPIQAKLASDGIGFNLSFESNQFSILFRLNSDGPQLFYRSSLDYIYARVTPRHPANERRAMLAYGMGLFEFYQSQVPLTPSGL